MYVTSGGSCGNETEFGKRERARRASQHERNLRVRQYVRVIYAFGYTLVCGVRQRMALGTVIYVSAKPALGGRTITEVQELSGCDLLHPPQEEKANDK